MKYIYIAPGLIGARLMQRVGPGPVVVRVGGRAYHTDCAEILGPDGAVIASVVFKRTGSPFGPIHCWIQTEAPIRLARGTVL